MGIFTFYRGNTRFWLKSYLLLGVAMLVVLALLYSNHVIERMQRRSQATTRLFSRFIAEVVLEVGDAGKRGVLQQVFREIELPLILTDAEGRPIAWHKVGIPQPANEEFERLLTIDPNNPPPGDLSELVEMVRRFDKTNQPIPVKSSIDGSIQGYIHFGASKLQRELRVMPLVLLAVFLVFMAVGLQGFRYLKLSEQRSIWVGMAKETAHQLGTPLSALLGWLHLMREHIEAGDYESLEKAIAEMGVDLGRLSKVSERFSKIGSVPELHPVDIGQVLERTVEYFHRRLPTLEVHSIIGLELEDTPPVQGNSELLEWVFENLLKNGIDAIGESGGKITIRSRYDSAGKRVEVLVRDTGKGITAGNRKRIFQPGFTTKRRGWGLGLTLTKRIVEDYHRGELRLVESQAGKGSLFLVRLRTA